MNASRSSRWSLVSPCRRSSRPTARRDGGYGRPGGAGGPGMLTVADDGSLLVTEMGYGMMGGGQVTWTAASSSISLPVVRSAGG